MASPVAGLGPGAGTRQHVRRPDRKHNATAFGGCVYWGFFCFLFAGILTASITQEVSGSGTETESAPAAPYVQHAAPSDYYSKLVTMAGDVYQEVTKSGPLPAERYDDNLFNHTAFRDWLLRKVVYREEVPEPAPMSYKCGVFVNHYYKLIFIRNRKAASTTVLDTFKAGCKTQTTMCMRPFTREDMEKQGLTHDEMWRTYYVISSTRNPWARAASGYDYTQDRWPVKTGVCGPVNFRDFCADPYLMGKMSNLFHCGAEGSFRGDDAWAYDFYHVEPAYHCMTDAGGQGLSVDYLIRYEHLHEDFEMLLDIINHRRDKSLPEIRGGRIRWRKQGVHVQAARNKTGGGLWREDAAAAVSSDRHAVRYRECGMECVKDVADFFETDLRLMKIQLPMQ